MRVFLSITTLLFASSVFAQAGSCLQGATNSELLTELEFRIGTGGGGTGEYSFPNYSCNDRYLTISLVNQVGDENTTVLDVVTSNDCFGHSKDLNTNKGGQISTGTIVAACEERYMYRLLLQANGEIKRLKDQDLLTSSQCRTQARLINQN